MIGVGCATAIIFSVALIYGFLLTLQGSKNMSQALSSRLSKDGPEVCQTDEENQLQTTFASY